MVTWRDSVNYKSSVCDPHKVTDSEGKICEPENIARNVIKKQQHGSGERRKEGPCKRGGGTISSNLTHGKENSGSRETAGREMAEDLPNVRKLEVRGRKKLQASGGDGAAIL